MFIYFVTNTSTHYTIQYGSICSLDKNIPSIKEKINWTQYFF